MDSNDSLVRQFLQYVAAKPRTYAEAHEAWRTSCPRLSIWEDAFAAGLVQQIRDENALSIILTDLGRLKLQEEDRS